MTKLHPKQRVYAELEDWYANGGRVEDDDEPPVEWLMLVLEWCFDIDDIPKDDQRRYAESWLRTDVARTYDLG